MIDEAKKAPKNYQMLHPIQYGLNGSFVSLAEG